MRRAILFAIVLGAMSVGFGCKNTAQGIKRDAHKDVEWVGDRF